MFTVPPLVDDAFTANYSNITNSFMQQEGWWSYEFCYHKRLRQIHVEDDKVSSYVPLQCSHAYNERKWDYIHESVNKFHIYLVILALDVGLAHSI